MKVILNWVSEFLVRLISVDYFVCKLIIRRSLKDLKPKSVLDLGCGSGILAPMFPKRGYLGMDIDSSLIERARKKYKGYNFLIGDVTKIDLNKHSLLLRNKKFDYILICGVIHHMDDSDAEKFLAGVKKHLKISGKCLIIEAIPPIFNWNILGHLNRKMDKGAYIRKLEDYKQFFRSFKIITSYEQIGGMADYAVFELKNYN